MSTNGSETKTEQPQPEETIVLPAPSITKPRPASPVQTLVPAGGHDERSINAFSSTEAFATGQRMAKAISSASLLPKEYQGHENIPNVMIVMELASRIGMPVLAVMQNIDTIHGRPSWRATFLIATINTCGRFTALRYRFTGEKGTPSWGCSAVAKDRETGEELVGEEITLKMADDEGWSKKAGSKWKTMAGQMLRYRSAAFWARVYAPELSLGMHTSEESADISSGVPYYEDTHQVIQQQPSEGTGLLGQLGVSAQQAGE